MSQSGDFWSQVIQTVVSSGTGFILGLLFRRRVAHAIVEAKKWLWNDILTTNVVAVRNYPPIELPPLNPSVFDHANAKFRNLRLIEIFDDELVVSAPVFGKLRLHVEKIPSEGKEDTSPTQLQDISKVKLVFRSESPIRLGIRETGRLNELVNIAASLFDGVELLSPTRNVTPKEDYVITEIPRITHFLAERTFDLQDEELATRVRGTQTKLSITSPSMKLVEAVKKYRFA